MAKSELELNADKKQNQRKGKKRRHEQQADEEVASKSLIVDNASAESETAAQKDTVKSKASKRKSEHAEAPGTEKRSKKSIIHRNIEHDDSDAVVEQDDEADNQLPTAEQLRESEKPENTIAVVTVRQMKKKKHQERLVAQKDQSADKEAKRNEEYLHKWKHARGEWKFEKLRQISIQQMVLDEEKITSECWPIALEYLAGSKGAAKQILTKLASDVLEQLDNESEQLEDPEARSAIIESVRYQRARELLQNFD